MQSVLIMTLCYTGCCIGIASPHLPTVRHVALVDETGISFRENCLTRRDTERVPGLVHCSSPLLAVATPLTSLPLLIRLLL